MTSLSLIIVIIIGPKLDAFTEKIKMLKITHTAEGNTNKAKVPVNIINILTRHPENIFRS
jgi:3-deoxy-D-manno-octulosonate 8-phosphate phosphatase KdsC-like HAD superfamily phosphatase